MIILKRDKTPDGTTIQIEDWRKDYSCFNTLSIAAYPIMRRLPNSVTLYWHKPGEKFRVSIDRAFNDDQEVMNAFEDLKTGKKSIKDFSNHFWDPWNAECL